MAKDMKPRDYEAALATAQSIIQAQAERINELVAMVEELTDKLENLEDSPAQSQSNEQRAKDFSDKYEDKARGYAAIKKLAESAENARMEDIPVDWAPDEGRSRILVTVDERFDTQCVEVGVALKGVLGLGQHMLGVFRLDQQAQMSIRTYRGKERDSYLTALAQDFTMKIKDKCGLSEGQSLVILFKLKEKLAKAFRGF
jgi:hypothetical protein